MTAATKGERKQETMTVQIEHECPTECTKEAIEALQAENEKLWAALCAANDVIRWLRDYADEDGERLLRSWYECCRDQEIVEALRQSTVVR